MYFPHIKNLVLLSFFKDKDSLNRRIVSYILKYSQTQTNTFLYAILEDSLSNQNSGLIILFVNVKRVLF